MVTVDLITGFLGAGKTTFIRRYISYLQKQGLMVRIIENEFGDVGVDTQLLQDSDCEIEDLSGLCMCCVGKAEFIHMLQHSAETGCDRIIVEPSGIYDVDEFFEVMSLPQIQPLCEIGNIFTIADPYGLNYMTNESEYLMFAQFLASSLVLISKTQLLTPDEIEQTIEKINCIMREKGCEAGLLADVCTKPWDELTEDDFEEMLDAGYSRFVHDREVFSHSEAFQSAPFAMRAADVEDIRRRIASVFESPACGMVFRIKGFVATADGQHYEVNCTTETSSINPTQVQENVLVFIGQQIRESEIREIVRRG